METVRLQRCPLDIFISSSVPTWTELWLTSPFNDISQLGVKRPNLHDSLDSLFITSLLTLGPYARSWLIETDTVQQLSSSNPNQKFINSIRSIVFVFFLYEPHRIIIKFSFCILRWIWHFPRFLMTYGIYFSSCLHLFVQQSIYLYIFLSIYGSGLLCHQNHYQICQPFITINLGKRCRLNASFSFPYSQWG